MIKHSACLDQGFCVLVLITFWGGCKEEGRPSGVTEESWWSSAGQANVDLNMAVRGEGSTQERQYPLAI